MKLSPTPSIKLGPQASPYAKHLVETYSRDKSGPDRDDSVGRIFSELAGELGLTTRHRQEPGIRYFELDLNSPIIYLTNPTPERLYSLVKLATQIERRDYGIHIGLLRATAYWGDLKKYASGGTEQVTWYTDSYVVAREESKARGAEMRQYLEDVYKLTDGVPGSIGEIVPHELIFIDEGTPVSVRDYLEMYGFNLNNEVLLNSNVIPEN